MGLGFYFGGLGGFFGDIVHICGVLWYRYLGNKSFVIIDFFSVLFGIVFLETWLVKCTTSLPLPLTSP